VDLRKPMEGRGCEVGGLVFGLLAWRATLRGVVEQTLYSRVFLIYGLDLAGNLSFSLVLGCLGTWKSS
jgi:hypothetical protein